jgi:hypothetical protein
MVITSKKWVVCCDSNGIPRVFFVDKPRECPYMYEFDLEAEAQYVAADQNMGCWKNVADSLRWSE